MRCSVLLLLAGLIGALACHADSSTPDRRAIDVADRVMGALGGHEAWNSLVGLRWTFESAVNDTVRPGRRHAWNKHSGWHRVEGVNRQGQKYVIIHKVGDPAGGMAWMDGSRIEGDSLAKLVTRAQSLWTNDTYWMLMPYKLRDPGVTLRYEGEHNHDGKPSDRIALSFEHVGETPGDHYWVDVDRGTHRVEQWEYILQGDPPPPMSWTWEGWEKHDGLWFPTIHRHDNQVIYTRNVETVKEFPPGIFEAP
jgi:hypothetical protein